ncbi:hypothetical protein CYMTET_35027, partial [Cymbomonas tetramitiformis]
MSWNVGGGLRVVQASDDRDGAVPVTTLGLDAVSTAAVTDAPYILEYNAVDEAGNQAATLQRRVSVVSPCVAPSTLCEEFTEELVCSSCEGTSCLCLQSTESEPEVTVEEYVPPQDVTPPV